VTEVMEDLLGMWRWTAPNMYCYLMDRSKGTIQISKDEIFIVLGWKWTESPEVEWNSVYYYCINKQGLCFVVSTHRIEEYAIRLN